MPEKEATARIKINKLLEAAGWRFFAEGSSPANIRLEPSVTIKGADLDALGDNVENGKKGFVDFLLLDGRGFPFIVLEAKAEDKDPLAAKEQARKYARSQNCRFVILSAVSKPTISPQRLCLSKCFRSSPFASPGPKIKTDSAPRVRDTISS